MGLFPLPTRSEAILLFENSNPEYGVAIANSETNLYNTIGTSFEFGGLEDGTMPSTKQNLMIKYLQFFGLFGKSINDNMEENLLGYNIYRSDDPGQSYIQLNSSLLTDTVYSDNIQISGMYYFYVKALYEEGISIPSNIDSVDVVVGIHNTCIKPKSRNLYCRNTTWG